MYNQAYTDNERRTNMKTCFSPSFCDWSQNCNIHDFLLLILHNVFPLHSRRASVVQEAWIIAPTSKNECLRFQRVFFPKICITTTEFPLDNWKQLLQLGDLFFFFFCWLCGIRSLRMAREQSCHLTECSITFTFTECSASRHPAWTADPADTRELECLCGETYLLILWQVTIRHWQHRSLEEPILCAAEIVLWKVVLSY